MLALLDTFDHRARQLLRSLETASIDVTPVVIQYDGDLPDGGQCPFTVYTGLEREGGPLFFDDVPVPAWCEIRQGRRPYAEILRQGETIGRIRYVPGSFREVQSVEWLLPDGMMSSADHYDRHGNHYATTYYSGEVAYQSVYRGPGEWAIEVDHVSRAVTMRSADRLRTFASLADFVSHSLDDLGLDDESVLINSLSHPLFVMRRRAARPRTILFWQEPMPGEIPGNMTMELEQPRALDRIVFFDDAVRGKVAARHPDTAVQLAYLSHLGQFAEKTEYDLRRAFTLTASDEIPGLPELLDAFPDVTFSVAALTQMSPKLHDLARAHPNLTLVPTASQRRIGEELERASVYLDINAGPQVLDVVTAAYHLGLVVLALSPHAKAPGLARVAGTPDELITRVRDATASDDGRRRALDDIRFQHGPPSAAEDYRRLLRIRPETAE